MILGDLLKYQYKEIESLECSIVNSEDLRNYYEKRLDATLSDDERGQYFGFKIGTFVLKCAKEHHAKIQKCIGLPVKLRPTSVSLKYRFIIKHIEFVKSDTEQLELYLFVEPIGTIDYEELSHYDTLTIEYPTNLTDYDSFERYYELEADRVVTFQDIKTNSKLAHTNRFDNVSVGAYKDLRPTYGLMSSVDYDSIKNGLRYIGKNYPISDNKYGYSFFIVIDDYQNLSGEKTNRITNVSRHKFKIEGVLEAEVIVNRNRSPKSFRGTESEKEEIKNNVEVEIINAYFDVNIHHSTKISPLFVDADDIRHFGVFIHVDLYGTALRGRDYVSNEMLNLECSVSNNSNYNLVTCSFETLADDFMWIKSNETGLQINVPIQENTPIISFSAPDRGRTNIIKRNILELVQSLPVINGISIVGNRNFSPKLNKDDRLKKYHTYLGFSGTLFNEKSNKFGAELSGHLGIVPIAEKEEGNTTLDYYIQWGATDETGETVQRKRIDGIENLIISKFDEFVFASLSKKLPNQNPRGSRKFIDSEFYISTNPGVIYPRNNYGDLNWQQLVTYSPSKPIPHTFIDTTTHGLVPNEILQRLNESFGTGNTTLKDFHSPVNTFNDLSSLEAKIGSLVFVKDTKIIYAKVSQRDWIPVSISALKIDGIQQTFQRLDNYTVLSLDMFEKLQNQGLAVNKDQKNNWFNSKGTQPTFTGSNSFDFVKRNVNQTIANGSILIGHNINPTGENGIALGSDIQPTQAEKSIYVGTGLKSNQNATEIVLGRFNRPKDGIEPNYAFSIGNGTTDENRSNLFAITENGDLMISGKILSTNPALADKVWTGSGFISISEFITAESFRSKALLNEPITFKHETVDGTSEEDKYTTKVVHYVVQSNFEAN